VASPHLPPQGNAFAQGFDLAAPQQNVGAFGFFQANGKKIDAIAVASYQVNNLRSIICSV